MSLFSRRNKAVDPEAAKALEDSRNILAETRITTQEAREVNDRMVELRRRNHFGEMLTEAYRRHA